MVPGKFYDFTAATERCSWISCISDINGIFNHENDITGAANGIYDFTFSSKGLEPGLHSYFFKFLFALLSVKELIKGFEGFF